MGCIFALANPDAREMWRESGDRSSRTRFRPAKQSVCSGAVSCSFVAVSLNADDLGFEAGDPVSQLGLRVGSEIFARKAARCVALGPWQIAFIHQVVTSQGNGLAVNP